jgi:hypothetical protein
MSSTVEAPEATPDSNVILLPSVTYDTPALTEFLGAVFHGDIPEGEHILAWSVRGARPGYPRPAAPLLAALRRTQAARALYVGTATCRELDDSGALRNRQDLFGRLWLVVLDDIGTKIPLGTLPQGLQEPSYIVETSEGNFQYGFVLDEPIDDLAQAQALVQLVYDSGWSDGGGSMPNKLVRLPGGVNGKPGAKGAWEVKLRDLTSRRFSPDELLQACKVRLPWAEVVKDPAAALKKSSKKAISRWGAITPTSANLDGTADPVLEWMYDAGLVKQEVGDWVTILCPWHVHHSTDDDTAGYSPLGRGGREFAGMRGFHCFHEHCRDRHASDLLTHVAAQGGPQAGVRDTTGELYRNWVYDAVGEKAIQISGEGDRMTAPIPLPSLRRMYPGKVAVYLESGKIRHRAMVDEWLENPQRVLVNGSYSDPTTEAPLTTFDGGIWHNIYRKPSWGEYEIEQRDIDRFTQFIGYLIPEPEEASFFLDWLACKVKSAAFRGPAMLMVTPTQGTGRGTLANMISTLLGPSNTISLTFDRLTGDSTFNDWQLNPLVICHETADLGSVTLMHRAYERMKGMVDFAPVAIGINRKNRPMITVPVYTSFLLFSNHLTALKLGGDDRRIYVITNTFTRETPEYFTELNAWLQEDGGAWADSVAQWLMAREVDTTQLYAPAKMSAGKRLMIEEGRSPIGRVVDRIVDLWEGPLISHWAVKQIADAVVFRYNISDPSTVGKQITHELNRVTTPLSGGRAKNRCRAWDTQVSFRAITERVNVEIREQLRTLRPRQRGVLLEKNDLKAITAAVLAGITEDEI